MPKNKHKLSRLGEKIIPLKDTQAVKNCAPSDILQLTNPTDEREVFARANLLLPLTAGVYKRTGVRLSGPTGTGKTSTLNALLRSPENFEYACAAIGRSPIPVHLVCIVVPHMESPREILETVRTGSDGTIEIVDSPFVECLEHAKRVGDRELPVVWLQENMRVGNAAVANAFVELTGTERIALPDGREYPASRISWVSDDNVTATRDYNLSPADDANKDRFPIGLEQGYDLDVMRATFLRRREDKRSRYAGIDEAEVQRVLDLAERTHERQNAGELLSIAPITPRSIEEYLELRVAFPHWPPTMLSSMTLLRLPATVEDRALVNTLNEDAFALSRSVAEAFDESIRGLV